MMKHSDDRDNPPSQAATVGDLFPIANGIRERVSKMYRNIRGVCVCVGGGGGGGGSFFPRVSRGAII